MTSNWWIGIIPVWCEEPPTIKISMSRNSSAPAPHEINTVWEKTLFVNSYAKVGIPDGIRAGCTISNTPPQAVRMLSTTEWTRTPDFSGITPPAWLSLPCTQR
ncbi:hypothetical protein M231_03660 [Tremella mesenterica]|uniref:Uncharacterized protein n=1 Tax=Tremella mesenterica TaxID=5217 RepID=A0A4Q1BMK2_TREME|nr:hypothetical protein M231_03660 [Tremella mesenterica]